MAAGNLIDLRRRVRSVKNIQQITRAMKFISASRLKKAQDRAFAARPYATRMLAVLNSLATRVDSTTHPLLSERNETKTMLVVITSDKGLCGSFNSTIIKGATNKIESEAGNKGHQWERCRPNADQSDEPICVPVGAGKSHDSNRGRDDRGQEK